LLGSLADQGDVDLFQVLAGAIVDLRSSADGEGRLSGTVSFSSVAPSRIAGRMKSQLGDIRERAIKGVLQ
jgi:hypothetical protein